MANITRKWTPWVAGFDPHGIYQDKDANRAFFKFIEHWQPEIRIAGGDIWDFKQLRKKSDAHERRDSMARDVAEGKAWLLKLQATHFLRGNHDERLWDLANQSEGVVQDYAKLIVKDLEETVRDLGCRMYPYNTREGVMRLGSLKVIHGFRAGISAARMSAKTYGSVMMGHIHQFQCSTIEGLEQRTGFAIPCLAQVAMEYNRHQEGALTHENGWSYGVVDLKSGAYQVWVARKFAGQWLLPTGLESF
jgi:hypothetical protein